MLRLLVVFTVLAILSVAGRVLADLENQQRGGEGGLFTSSSHHIQLVVPRTWHASDQASYPGMLLWLEHDQPDAHIVLTADPFTRQLYCSWPVSCRSSHDSLATKFACSLRIKLAAERIHVGPIEAGPKENEVAGMETMWFEYDDGKHFLRQAVGVTDDRAVSLLLSTTSADARASYVRAFEQALRTLAPWTEQPASATDAAPPQVPDDAGVLPDAAGSATTAPVLVSAPASRVQPVGTCAQ